MLGIAVVAVGGVKLAYASKGTGTFVAGQSDGLTKNSTPVLLVFRIVFTNSFAFFAVSNLREVNYGPASIIPAMPVFLLHLPALGVDT